MQPVIMITNGGPHPADYYAACAAAEIIQIEASAAGEDVLKGRRLENKILDILEKYHQDLIDKENHLVKSDHEHLLSELDPHEHGLDAAVDAIVEAGKASSWKHLFETPRARNMIKLVVGKHMSTAMHVTRSWHVDENPDHPHAETFKAKKGL